MLLTLVEAAAGQGWDQRVLHPFGEAENSLIGARLPSGMYEAFPARSVREVPATAWWAYSRLRAFRPDVVHVHLFHALVLVAALPRPHEARLLLTHHHGGRYEYGGERARQLLDRVCVRRYDCIVAVSPATQTLLEADYHLPSSRIRMIANGWSGHPLPRKRSAGLRVICVGNLRPEKRHDLLIEAFGSVSASYPEAKLVLVGDGPLRAQLEEQSRSLGISSKVRFTGAVSDVWPLLADADVFALASRYETLGIAVLEAMAAGLPVVATRVGGLAGLVEPEVTGTLVEADDVPGLAGAIERLLASPEDRNRMGDAARVRAKTQRSDGMVTAYLDLYRQLGSGR